MSPDQTVDVPEPVAETFGLFKREVKPRRRPLPRVTARGFGIPARPKLDIRRLPIYTRERVPRVGREFAERRVSLAEGRLSLAEAHEARMKAQAELRDAKTVEERERAEAKLKGADDKADALREAVDRMSRSMDEAARVGPPERGRLVPDTDIVEAEYEEVVEEPAALERARRPVEEWVPAEEAKSKVLQRRQRLW